MQYSLLLLASGAYGVSPAFQQGHALTGPNQGGSGKGLVLTKGPWSCAAGFFVKGRLDVDLRHVPMAVASYLTVNSTRAKGKQKCIGPYLMILWNGLVLRPQLHACDKG